MRRKEGGRCGEERTRTSRLVHVHALSDSLFPWLSSRSSKAFVCEIMKDTFGVVCVCLCGEEQAVVFLVTVACWHTVMIRDKYFETLHAVLAGTLPP